MAAPLTATVSILAENGPKKLLEVPLGITLSEALEGAHVPLDHPCGNRGLCKKCRVHHLSPGGLSAMTGEELSALGGEKGIRLACMARITGDVTIGLGAVEQFSSAVTDGIMQDVNFKPLYLKEGYGVGVDIGTTTLAVKVVSREGVLGEASGKNPQTAFGADVITRVGLAMNHPEKALLLAKNLRESLFELIDKACSKAPIPITRADISGGVVVGNTAMLYLFTLKNPRSLAAAPFAADCLFGEYCPPEFLGLEASAKVYLPHCIGAFVGADVAAAILASGMLKAAGSAPALLTDIGTNGEMALLHKGALTCCSTAAGPAFEGAGILHGMHGLPGAIDEVWVEDGAIKATTIGNQPPRGICGSGLVSGVRAMLELGVLDETGSMDFSAIPNCPEEWEDKDFFPLMGEIGLFASDIRNLQLAKSAIRGGIESLLKINELAPQDLRQLYIAGGFGSFLNLGAAAHIGLIPPELVSKALVIGNAALSGALMLLNDTDEIEVLKGLAESPKTLALDLSTSPYFRDFYIEHMLFPEE